MKKIPTWIIIVVAIALVVASKFIFFAPKVDAWYNKSEAVIWE